jgi:aminopeptidase N
MARLAATLGLLAVLTLAAACQAARSGDQTGDGGGPQDSSSGDLIGDGDLTSGGDLTGDGGAGDALAQDTSAQRPPALADWSRDILATALHLDLATQEGRATLTLAPSSSLGASFEVGDLEILSVEDDLGPLNYLLADEQLDVGLPAGDQPATLTVRYHFQAKDDYTGWMPTKGVSFLWPYYCGNLFPCHSEPADGLTFTLDISGQPQGQQVIYPLAIPTDAPSYMPALAVGNFAKLDLGTTTAGTRVLAWYLPGQQTAMHKGTANLLGVVDFLEQTYGPYPFGDTVASVSANWDDDPYGGMEHHPFWHVATEDLDNQEVHAHEAAHGWFGDGVRLACWEDLVLSEGTTSYISARALESQGVDVWPEFECLLAYACDPDNEVNTIALPDTCGQIDLVYDPLWSEVPYMKGAYFFRAVADLLGTAALDQLLADFYQANVGQAARMQDLLDALLLAAGPQASQLDALATAWLRTQACPLDYTTLCP